MAAKIYYLDGHVKWAKVYKPDDKYKRYSVDLYMDEPSMAKFIESGAQTTIKTDDQGKYVRLSRAEAKLIKGETVSFGPPELLDKDNNAWDGSLIGNGSHVTCKVTVYDTVKGKGTRLEAVRVNELVIYNKTDVDQDEDNPF